MRQIAISVVAAILLVIVGAGCADPNALEGGKRGPGLSAKGMPVMATAPADGHYVLALRPNGVKALVSLPHSECFVKKGEPLGFATGEDGVIRAVAGTTEIPLDATLPTIKYCCWYAESSTPSKQKPDAISKAFRRLHKAIRKIGEPRSYFVDGPDDLDDPSGLRDYVVSRLSGLADLSRHEPSKGRGE